MASETTGWTGRVSAPGPRRLLEPVDPRRTAEQRQLAELVEHGRGRGVDLRAEHRELQDRSVRLGDGQEDRLDSEHLPGADVNTRDFVRVRAQVAEAAVEPHDDWRDPVARPRGVV